MKKTFFQVMDLSSLKKFVQKDTEISKEEFIRRCAAEVPLSFLHTLKQFVFYRIGRGPNDELYLV